ncbi:hypothetical protein CEXT_692561 [Caerostris extrusa]|uniref:Uncharacterized protein n=1 Tax=Caerostris extrusa TaxID=172846 RepID=A0AAV4W2G8_CAEEX|nr:hypothetical protein CEXT_692561 [Caerostris extrusa]
MSDGSTLTYNWWSTSTVPLSVALSVIHPSLPGRKEQSNGRQMWKLADSVNIPATCSCHISSTGGLSADAKGLTRQTTNGFS